MNAPSQFRLSHSMVLLGLVFVASTGCSMLGKGPDSKLGAELTKPALGAITPGQQPAKYTVIFQPDKGSPQGAERSLTESITLQQALEQAGAFKKFRRIEVELVRSLPNGGIHRIPCEYDRKTKRMNPEFDYALLPGDKLLVKEDTSTIIDDMIETAGGTLGKRYTSGRSASGGRYRIEG